MFTHVSQATRDVLAGCGLHDRTVGAGKVMGIGAGVPKGDRTHPLTAPAGEEDTASRYVNGKRTPGEPAPVNREEMRQHVRRGYGEPLLRLIADNVDVVPTRQGRSGARPSLVCIEGGRV